MSYEVKGDPSMVTEEGYGNIDLEVERDIPKPGQAEETGDPSMVTEEGYGEINMEYE